jgi:hypothetical protein
MVLRAIESKLWILVKEKEGKIEFNNGKEELTLPLFTPASHFTFSSCTFKRIISQDEYFFECLWRRDIIL